MTDRGADSKLFEEVIRELLEQGMSARFQARGSSMSPAIRDGEVVEVTPVIVSELRKDDIVLAKSNYGFRLHRIVHADPSIDVFLTRGDCGQENDPALKGVQIFGLARAKEVQVGRRIVQARFNSLSGWALRCAARGQVVGGKLLRRAVAPGSTGARIRLGLLGLLLLAATFVNAQVTVDATTQGNSTMTGAGAHTLTFAHTTANVANRVLLVGVSMNITAVPGASVTGVTYNGTALSLVGAHNDTNATRRVEVWYLLAPTNGAFNVVVTVNLPSAGSVGVEAGATTFTGVDQTVPLGSFVSADGAAGANSQLDVPSVINGMLLDTLATDGTQTVAVSAPQVQQWNQNSAANANPGVRGVGSSRAGAPNVPISETFSGTSNWAQGAISINPITADIGVTTSVSAVPLGQNSTYVITVTNKGPSAANGVTLTDTFAATNLTLVSDTPSAGTTCAVTTTIN